MRGRRPPHAISPRIAFHCWEVLVRRRQDCANILGTPTSMDHLSGITVAAFPELYIESGYEQHCLGTANSGRSYARRAHASGSCPRSRMSPSVGSILGEQG